MNSEKLAILLPTAKRQGLLIPSKESNPCLNDLINTANYLLYCLDRADRAGLDTEQVSSLSKLNPNSARCFLRELQRIKLVTKVKPGGKNAIWFISR